MKHLPLHRLPNYGIRISRLAIHDYISDNSEIRFLEGISKWFWICTIRSTLFFVKTNKSEIVLKENSSLRKSQYKAFLIGLIL